MIDHCPHCSTRLSLTQEQKARLTEALAALGAGKTIGLKCPKCTRSFQLDRNGAVDVKKMLRPPEPPNLDWLKAGIFSTEEKVEDVPMALVLHGDTEVQTKIIHSLETVGYQVVVAESPEDAKSRMQFVNFACVALDSCVEGNLHQSGFHRYMREMPMFRRRYIFYILMGPEFNTLYSLEALANSANLVVNSKDLDHLDLILRKAIPEYEELFGPILEEIAAYGKR
ncbi:MAG: hypothetical protein CSA34_04605 [Desulfobulbus propionicus]|nr:MAG: hypothetical protein CSA34_04605 [Desulfobulbus propionicus]